MVAMVHVRPQQVVGSRQAITILVLTFAFAGAVATVGICGLLSLIFGPLPAWVWYGVLFVEIGSATFIACAFAVGSSDHTRSAAECNSNYGAIGVRQI
jgi:uncharacterized membrane protein